MNIHFINALVAACMIAVGLYFYIQDKKEEELDSLKKQEVKPSYS